MIFTLANDRELLGILLPCALEVMVEDSFSEAVKHSSRDHEGLHIILFEVEDAILHILDLGILSTCPSLKIVLLGEGVV